MKVLLHNPSQLEYRYSISIPVYLYQSFVLTPWIIADFYYDVHWGNERGICAGNGGWTWRGSRDVTWYTYIALANPSNTKINRWESWRCVTSQSLQWASLRWSGWKEAHYGGSRVSLILPLIDSMTGSQYSMRWDEWTRVQPLSSYSLSTMLPSPAATRSVE